MIYAILQRYQCSWHFIWTAIFFNWWWMTCPSFDWKSLDCAPIFMSQVYLGRFFVPLISHLSLKDVLYQNSFEQLLSKKSMYSSLSITKAINLTVQSNKNGDTLDDEMHGIYHHLNFKPGFWQNIQINCQYTVGYIVMIVFLRRRYFLKTYFVSKKARMFFCCPYSRIDLFFNNDHVCTQRTNISTHLSSGFLPFHWRLALYTYFLR